MAREVVASGSEAGQSIDQGERIVKLLYQDSS